MRHPAFEPRARPRLAPSTFVALTLVFVSLAPSLALADVRVTTIEHGPWPVAVTAVQTDIASQGRALHVCVHDGASESCLPCGRYSLAFDEIGTRAFTIGACDPATGTTEVTLVDRSALFDHAHVVPRPVAVTIQAQILESVSSTGGAAPTGGSTLGCTARIRPYLRDLEHGTTVQLGPDHFQVRVLHAGIEASALGDGWMLVSEARISEDVDYEVVELDTSEIVMTGHASMVCASETDTSVGIDGVMVGGLGSAALTTELTQTSTPIRVQYSGLPRGGGWIAIADVGSGPSSYRTSMFTSGATEGVIVLPGQPAGTYSVRAFADQNYTQVIAFTTVTIADQTDPECLGATPVDRAAMHFDLPAPGRVRSQWIQLTTQENVAIEAHGVHALRVFRACSSSNALVMHNRQVDVGTGHARVSANGLTVGTYEIRVEADDDAVVTIDVTPRHIPVLIDFRAGATVGVSDGAWAPGAMGEFDMRFDFGGTDMSASGGVGLAMVGEHIACDGFGPHGCGTGGPNVDATAYTMVAPAFLAIGPSRDTVGFRFRIELAPGLTVLNGVHGSLTFSNVTPMIMLGGGFDFDAGPLSLNLRSYARFVSAGDGKDEILGVGWLGSFGATLTF
jgi:hypothetical protein